MSKVYQKWYIQEVEILLVMYNPELDIFSDISLGNDSTIQMNLESQTFNWFIKTEYQWQLSLYVWSEY